MCLKRILKIFSYIINVGTNFGFVVSPFNDENMKCSIFHLVQNEKKNIGIYSKYVPKYVCFIV